VNRPLHRLRAALRPLWREIAIAYYRWALREIPLTHPDLPRIVVRLRALLDERCAEPVRSLARWL
jgi:hypothetical protein